MTTANRKPTQVAVCIATCRRPRGLERLLAALAEQRLAGSGARMKVVVVDNDPEGETRASVQEAIERWRPKLDELVSEIEAQPGISFARNRGLEAAGDADFIAFIDDDEEPAPNWLSELFAVQAAYDADVVRGPVLPRFETEPEAWIIAGGFFDRPRHATGTQLSVAYTHNVLIRWPRFRDLRFSGRFAKSGGEDAHFFGQMVKCGAVIVWADDAVVYEWQPAARHTVTWLVRRQYRIGLMRAVIDRELQLGTRPRLATVVQAFSRIVRGMVQLLKSLPGPKQARVRALSLMAAGVGRLAGLVGLWFEEYRDVPGRSRPLDRSERRG